MTATAQPARCALRAVPALAPPLGVAAPDAAHARVAAALRGARARTGLSEQQVVEKLAASGCALGFDALRDAESDGVLALAVASALADLYGTTTDCLAGRRLGRGTQPILELRL